ncbi:MAG: FAD-binding oxidoreductase [Proteobacteria bacterium]|nr:FAD-binding oxidoreductase [Pseudomonadota bacterium]
MSLLTIDRDLARDSYYAATAPRMQTHAPLAGDHTADVAVVGGGLAGLSAALELAERGMKVTLLEARQMGWGASGRNGGQAIHGLAMDQEDIETELGAQDARTIWAMSLEALALIQARRQQHRIDCDWQDGWLAVATSAGKARKLLQWTERMNRVYDAGFTPIEAAALPGWIASPRYHAGAFDAHSGHMHPLKYALGLARAAQAAGVTLHEDSPVTALTQGETITLTTSQGSVRARQVLLAGNVYLGGVAPQLEARIMPVGTYIVCSEPVDPAQMAALIPNRAAVCDTDFVLDYFRPTADHRMLFGGRVSYSTRTPGDVAGAMRQRMVATFPQLAQVGIAHAWGGFVDITMSRAPDFGRLGGNLYYLQGFSGHGLALTGLAGKLVAEAIDGDASRFDVFTRFAHRPFPGGRLLRTPALVLGMAWYRLRDMLG